MMQDLEKAKELLSAGEYTCAICRGDRTFLSEERGVGPLVSWLESGEDLCGYAAADKVVGKGAAFLYILLGVRAVYARVISAPAAELLQKNGVFLEYEEKADHIINRKGDGICPFEEAVWDLEDPAEAYSVIRMKMAKMKGGSL